MATIAAFIGTALGTFIVTVFHKPLGEISARALPFLYLENIESASKKVETVVGVKKEEEVTVPTPRKARDVGDYVDSAWSDADVPKLAFEKMESVLDIHMSEETAQKMTNTCKKLLAGYAMEGRRRKQFEKIRDAIFVSYSNIAQEIDMSLFSQCSFWEGKIALYR